MRSRLLSAFLLFQCLIFCRSLQAQNGNPVGLPVVFVHGICDGPDNFLPIERDVKAMLQAHYPNQYQHASGSGSDEYVSFYDGVNVHFQETSQAGPAKAYAPVEQSSVAPSTRFFLVALDDPGQEMYQDFDEANEVMNIPIFQKGNELAHIIWAIKQITGVPRVIVVAHSMGGLDIRSYVEGLASSNGTSDATLTYLNDISAVITLDTPHGGSDFAAVPTFPLAGFFPSYSCILNASVDKSEMVPSGESSIIPQLNYNGPTPYGFTAQPLPSALTITSIASYWFSPQTITRIDENTDDALSAATQDLASNLANPVSDSFAKLIPDNNTFDSDFPEFGDSSNVCGLPFTPLHFLTCTGGVPQTFGLIEDAVRPFALMSTGTLQITPASADLEPGATTSFTASTSAATVWSIREGKNGGTFTDGTVGTTVTYQAPPNYTHSLETFHVIAISTQDPTQYAQIPVQVTSSLGKSSTTPALSFSATQVPVGANLTVSVSVLGDGGIPTGTVTFFDGGTELAEEIVNFAGLAIFDTTSLSLGFHSISAAYNGDSNYSSSKAAPVSIAVVAINPQLSVSPSSGILGITSFLKTDEGFTPNGLITHTVTFPHKSVSTLQTYADSSGSYQYARVYSSETSQYTQVDTDVTTGRATAPVSWTVTAAVVNDFSVAALPTSQSFPQSGSVGFNVQVNTTSGIPQTVILSAANLPSGLGATFTPNSVTSGSTSNLTVTATSNCVPGSYVITVNAAGATATHTAQVSLNVVQAAGGPVLTVNPTTVRFNSQPVGSISGPENVILINKVNGSGPVTINSIQIAAGSDYMFVPPPATPVILNPLVPLTLQVAFAPSDTGTRNGQILIYDSAPGSPQTVSLTGTGIAAEPTTGTINVNATLNGSPLPSGYAYTYSLSGPNSYTGGGAYSFTVAPGTYSIAFSGTPGYLALASVNPSPTQSVAAGASVTFTLNFTAPNDFLPPSFLSAPNGFTPQVVKGGETASYTLGVGVPIGSASTPITLSVLGLPRGVSAVFNPQPVFSGTDSTLTVTTDPSTPPGVYTLGAIGTNSSGLIRAGERSTLVVTSALTSPVQLASLNSSSVPANGASTVNGSGISADGRYVVFSTSATNLTTSNPSGHQEVYLRDTQAGTTVAVSVSSSGALADLDSGGSAISADGRYVAFWSGADNLFAGSVLGTNGIYVRDLVQGFTEREDVNPDGTISNGSGAFGAKLSADGRFVAFESNATNLVAGTSGTQVYVRDRKSGAIYVASAASDGTPANGTVAGCAISADGRFIAFTSAATNLVSQDTAGLFQLYLKDLLTGSVSLASSDKGGKPANAAVLSNDIGTYGPSAISADGRYVVFASMATNLSPAALDGQTAHLFLHDLVNARTTLIDTDSVGVPIGGWPSFISAAITSDGRFVTFRGFSQVLIRDTVSNQTAVISVAADGSGANANVTPDPPDTGMAGGGTVVAFASNATNLVSTNTSALDSVFVAQNPFVSSIHLQSITLSSNTTSGGDIVTGTLKLSAAAPAGGASVSIWTNSNAAQVPGSVLIPSGAVSATVSIATSLVNRETVIPILVSYNGGSAVALLSLGPSPQLSVSPSSWDFGDQPLGTTSPVQSFSISNSGTAALSDLSASVGSGKGFQISTNTCTASIPAGGACSVSITFSPNTAGLQSDALDVSFAGSENTQSIPVTGSGTVASMSVAPSAITFPTQAVQTGALAAATLTNFGNAPLPNVSIKLQGPNAGDFSVMSDGCSGFTVPPNSSCAIAVSFSPQSIGQKLANLAVSATVAGAAQTQTTALSGSGGLLLTANVKGTGSGVVSSSPGGISCGSSCSAAYLSGSSVVLTASPMAGSSFAGWAGACQGSNPTCTVAMNSALSVTGEFNDTSSPTVSISSPPNGSAINGTVPVSITAVDNIGVAAIKLLLDGQNVGPELTTPPYSVNLNTTLITNGVHSLTAQARDAAGNVGISSVDNVTIDNSTDFGIGGNSASAMSATVSAGGMASYSLAITPTVGFTGTVSFTCAGAPTAANCTVAPNPTSVSGTATATVTVTVTTTSRSTSMANATREAHPPEHSTINRFFAVIVFPLPLLILLNCRRIRSHRYIIISVLLVSGLLGGCGGQKSGGFQPPPSNPPVVGTPAGNYVVVVTASSGTVSHSLNLMLTVN